MSSCQKEVRVGIACFVTYKDPSTNISHILVGQRKGSHGSGTWQLPGGHLEMLESFESCAVREVKEETNLDLHEPSVQFLTATNNIMLSEQKHYVVIFLHGSINIEDKDKAKAMEPHKLEGDWEWVTLEELKSKKPLFSPLKKFVETQDLKFLSQH